MKMLTAFGSLCLDLRRALHIDVEQQVFAFLFRLAQKTLRRAVVVAEDVGILEKFILARSSPRIRSRDEKIFAAVLLVCRAAARVV